MAYINIEYTPKHKQMKYVIKFNPSVFGVEQAATSKDSFEGCLEFIMGQFSERTRLVPHMQPFTIGYSGENLPERQKVILERIVELHNRAPELYGVFANPKHFESLEKYYGHKKE